MMKKQHGPAFKAATIDLIWCTECRGQTVIQGVFHELSCTKCHASGWVCAETGAAVPVDVLVTQLGLLLNKVQRSHIALQKAWPKGVGAADQYNQNNRRGAGGTNFTGD